MQTPAEKYLIDTIKKSLNQYYEFYNDIAKLINIVGRSTVIENNLINRGFCYLRYFTAGMAKKKADRFIEWYVPLAIKIRYLLKAFPYIRKFFKKKLYQLPILMITQIRYLASYQKNN